MNVRAIRPTVVAMQTIGDRQRLWLDFVLREMNVSRTELARRADIDPSTLTKFVNSPTGAAMAAKTQAAIEQVSGLLFAQFGSDDWRPRGLKESEATPYVAEPAGPLTNDAIAAIKQGRNAVDAWVLRSRAMEDLGYLPGDILLVDLNERAVAGDVVCAQIYHPGMRAETIFRLYEKPWLVGAGPESRRPIAVDDDHVVIKGVVVAMLRPRAVLRAA